jgi:DNA-binding CsgD family transcriptional regulator
MINRDEMTPREEIVYKLRFEGMVYRLIGEQLGVSGGRARIIYKKCLKKIEKKASER